MKPPAGDNDGADDGADDDDDDDDDEDEFDSGDEEILTKSGESSRGFHFRNMLIILIDLDVLIIHKL